MDGVEGFIFANYLGDKAAPVTADGGLLHIQLDNRTQGSQPFATAGIDIQNLGTLSNVSTVALSSGGALNNQLFIQDSAVTLETQGQPRQGWSASAVNILNPTDTISGNIAVVDNSAILYDEGSDEFSRTRIRIGAVNVDIFQNSVNVLNNQLWVSNSQLDINSLYAVSARNNWTQVTANRNSVYVSDSKLRVNPYADGNRVEGIYVVSSTSTANNNWLELANNSLTVLACQTSTAQSIETVKAVESAENNTLIVRDSDIESASTIYFAAGTANLASGSVLSKGNSVFIGSTTKDKKMTINYTQDSIGTYVYGGRVYSTDSTNTVQALENRVSIENLSVNNNSVVRGGYIWGNGANGVADGNEVTITDSFFSGKLILNGGVVARLNSKGTATGQAINNIISVSGTQFRDVGFVAGQAQSGEASGNQLNINDSTFNGATDGAIVFAGGKVNDKGAANDNVVQISQSKLADGAVIFGAYATEANNNSVIIGENVTNLNGERWKAGSIFGWSGILATGGNTFTTASSFDVENFGGFQHYNFILNENSFADGAVINVTGNQAVFFQPDGADHSTVAIGGANLDLTPGTYTLINSNSGFVNNDNIALEAGKLADDLKTDLTITSVESVIRVEKSTLNKDDYDLSIVDGTSNDQSLVLDIKGPGSTSDEINSESNALMESSLSTMTTHFAADDLFVDSVLRSRDGKRDGLFTAARGGKWSYDTRTRIENNIVSGLLGYGAKLSNDLTMGAFIEMGHGSYDTRTHVAGTTKAGGGSHNYGGLGLFGDYAMPSIEGLHFTGYLKVGLLRNEFNSNIAGANVDYDRTGVYWGAHLGTHYDWDLTQSIRSRVFLSYFYDGQGDESFDIAGEGDVGGAHVSYDAIHAHRVQLGSMFEFAVSNTWRPYLGLTFEQILAAEAKGTATDAQGTMDLNSSDLEGSTGILSAGWTYQDGNFSTELGLSGYAGTRNGVSGQIQANWKF